MWNLRGDLQELQIGSTGGPREPLTVYLRPDRVYRFGRQHKEAHNDFAWSEPKSASRRHVEIRSGPTSKTHIRIAETQYEPTYSITVKNLTKKAWPVQHKDGQVESICADAEYMVADGDEVSFTLPSRKATFIWRPLDLLCTLTRKLDDVAQFAIYSGCRYLEQKAHTDEAYTHMMVKVISLKASVARALIEQRHIVGLEWFTRLQRACTPRKSLPESDPDYSADDALSLLERDYDTAWPRETDSVPDAQADDEYGARVGAEFAVNEKRKGIFRGTLVVDTVDDDLSAPWMTVLALAGARTLPCAILDPNADAEGRISGAVRDFMERQQVPAGTPVYLHVTVGLPPKVLDMIHRAAVRCGAVGLIKLQDIQEAIYRADRARMHVESRKQEAGPAADGHTSRILAPPSSAAAPIAEALHSIPINPARRILAPPSSIMDVDDAAPSPTATQNNVDADGPPAATEQVSESMAPPPPRKKLVRRAGQKNSVLDAMFGGDPPVHTHAHVGSQTGSLAAEFGLTPGSSQAYEGSQDKHPSSSLPAGTSRTAGLKRRAGDAREHGFNFDEARASLPKPEPEVAAKRGKLAEDVSHASAQPTFKRKADLMVAEPPAAGRTTSQRASPSKQSTAAARPTKKSRKAAAEEVEHQAEAAEVARAKYLQVDKGKRKVTQEEAELNKEFNELKIVKPVLTAPVIDGGHRVGWRDRDLDEEEFAEAQKWEHHPGASFFNIVRVPLGRTKPAPLNQSNGKLANGWGHRPNFKAFRPKNSAIDARPARQNAKLQISTTADFGLLERHASEIRGVIGDESADSGDDGMLRSMSTGRGGASGNRAKKRPRLAVLDEESDDDLVPSKAGPAAKRKAASTKKAPGGGGHRKIGHQEISDNADAVDWNMDHDDADNDNDNMDRAATLAASKGYVKRATQRSREHVIDLDSEDDLTFEGFGKKAPAKRKRG